MGNPEMSYSEGNFMSNAEAQEEANMIRSKMEQDPDTGLIKDRKPTAEDYDKALQVVQEMKRLAAEQDLNEKDINKVLRVGNKILEQIGFWAGEVFIPLGQGAFGPDEAAHEAAMHRFEDAEYKLQQLRKQAKNFSEAQVEAEKTWQPPTETNN